MRHKKKSAKGPTKRKKQIWEQYEDAVRTIVQRHLALFHLGEVKATSGKVTGGTGPWKIEVIGYTSSERKVVLFEVRRVNRNVSRPDAGEFAFRIQDTAAARGYFVTPLGRRLTRGARAVAEKTKLIHHIEVSRDATPENYILRYLNLIFARFTDSLADAIGGMKDHFRIIVADKEGKALVELTPEGLYELGSNRSRQS
jgi:hypothetical protein